MFFDFEDETKVLPEVEARNGDLSNPSKNNHRSSAKSNGLKKKEGKKSKKDEEEDEEDLPDVGFMRILKLNKPEWLYMTSKLVVTVLIRAFSATISPQSI